MLANEITTLLHGIEAADTAAETARRTFEEGAIGDSLPSIEIGRETLEQGVGILTLFVTAGLAASNGEARRHVQGGAVRINDEPVTDERMMVVASHLNDGIIKLSLGKKKHVLVRPR